MQSLCLYTPNHPGLAVSCCLVDVLRELLRNRLESMILQLCHPCPRYTFQPVTRDPTSFISCLEPASKVWSRCLGIYLDVSGGSDALPSVPWVWYVAIFHLRGACTQQMLSWLSSYSSAAVPWLTARWWSSPGLALLEGPSEWKAWNANVVSRYYRGKSCGLGLIVNTAPDGQSRWSPYYEYCFEIITGLEKCKCCLEEWWCSS